MGPSIDENSGPVVFGKSFGNALPKGPGQSLDPSVTLGPRLASRNTAPGPDGVPGRALVIALSVLGNKLRQIFTICLNLGISPLDWKEVSLVLPKKKGRAADSPSACPPRKSRGNSSRELSLTVSMSRVGPDLSDWQFGFRQGHSTVDAARCVH